MNNQNQEFLAKYIAENRRVMRMRELLETTGLSRSSVYGRLCPSASQFDPSFPKQIKLGTGPNARAVGWIREEVLAWLAGLSQ
jgi:prophage regulatory protein